eukprot:scaffold275429_cov35-Tisochrysis_lutea.AAC.1
MARPCSTRCAKGGEALQAREYQALTRREQARWEGARGCLRFLTQGCDGVSSCVVKGLDAAEADGELGGKAR